MREVTVSSTKYLSQTNKSSINLIKKFSLVENYYKFLVKIEPQMKK